MIALEMSVIIFSFTEWIVFLALSDSLFEM